MPSLTPVEFVTKWQGSLRTERAASQEHFIDLCRMLDVKTPNEADRTGDFYAFEKGAEKTGGGGGFADVWKKGYFAWEYKGKRKDLDAAYGQLLQYREALDNPPLLVVCDLDRFEIHTNFTNTPKHVHRFSLTDLLDGATEPLKLLRAVMLEPDELKPGKTREELTAEAARQFASLAASLRERGHGPQAVAHFLNKLLFCMFAEDAGLLPRGVIERLTEAGRDAPDLFTSGLSDLFGKMSHSGGLFGAERIQWFNGGLFDGPEVLPMVSAEVYIVQDVARLDWSQVEPAIFGTLFERGLDPSKRSQLGAHYTDRESIVRLTEAVLMAPLRKDLEEMKTRVERLLSNAKRITSRTPSDRNPMRVFQAFLDRLRAVRVLDPACGSGNFLYVALQLLKDLERETILWGSLTFQTPMQFPEVGPQAVLGIEVNPYAAELARVVVWIGEIQWMLSNGFAYMRDPILRVLDNIQCRDAVLDATDSNGPSEPEWPAADVIIGNPPFLGGKLMRRGLGGEYVDALFDVYKGRVPAEADLVTYWFEKARAAVDTGNVKRVGLLATQGIRGGKNRTVLERIKRSGDLFFARSDDVWVVDGAAVHVSFVGFDDGSEQERTLDGASVAEIHPNLTTGVDVTVAKRLRSNLGIAFMGDTKGGAFDVPAEVAKRLLKSPNPDGRPNSDVVRPWANGRDVTQRPRNMWIIDFGVSMPETEAALYEAPFEYVLQHVRPQREKNRRDGYRRLWWLHVEPRSGMRAALAGKPRFLATMRTAKHRLFVWLDPRTVPDSQLIVFAFDDDYSMGVLQSSVHETWARATGTQLREAESGFRYTPTTCFETFPFPEPTPKQHTEISTAAKHLDAMRRGWLLPPEADEEELQRRTLTNLYNKPPAWLRIAHERLDRGVHDAYGLRYPLSAEELLQELVKLNLERCVSESCRPPVALEAVAVAR
jgi:type II restriction/modification system DNA methylase subunit YeeA